MTALAVAGEFALADSYCKQFGLDPSGLPLKGIALVESCRARDAMFLPLSISTDAIHFVDSAQVSRHSHPCGVSTSLPLQDVECLPDLHSIMRLETLTGSPYRALGHRGCMQSGIIWATLRSLALMSNGGQTP